MVANYKVRLSFIVFMVFLFFALLSVKAIASNQLSEAEKKYLTAAHNFLSIQLEYGKKVATAMAGLNTGDTTLGNVRDEIQSGLKFTNSAYYDIYTGYGTIVVPTQFDMLHQQIERSYKMITSAYGEYLEYWKDGNLEHLESANKTFEKGVRNQNDAINGLGLIYQDMKATN